MRTYMNVLCYATKSVTMYIILEVSSHDVLRLPGQSLDLKHSSTAITV